MGVVFLQGRAIALLVVCMHAFTGCGPAMPPLPIGQATVASLGDGKRYIIYRFVLSTQGNDEHIINVLYFIIIFDKFSNCWII